MQIEEATWLAGLIAEAIAQIDDGPGLTIEVEGRPHLWLQVILESGDDRSLTGFLLNMPYREHQGDPLETLAKSGFAAPPGTIAVRWEDGQVAQLWVRPDIPLIPLALLVGDLLERLVGAPAESELTVQIERGY